MDFIYWRCFLVCLLVGFVCAYFLNAYIVLTLGVIAITLLIIILKGPHQAEDGIAALFISGFVVAFLLGLIMGCLPYVQWRNWWEYISSLGIRKYFKDYILR